MSKTKSPGEPRGELVIRTLAMPANTNPAGDIFGGRGALCRRKRILGYAAFGVSFKRVKYSPANR